MKFWVQIVSFSHVSLFRNFRTLRIAHCCSTSFSFRIPMYSHVLFRTFLCHMSRIAFPRLFRHFLLFSWVFVSHVYRLVPFSFSHLFCSCPARWRGAPRPARPRGAWRGNRPFGPGGWRHPPVVMPRIEPSHGCFAAFSRVVGTALLVVEFLGRACCLGFRSSALLGPRLRLGPRRPGDAGRRRGDPCRTHVELVLSLGVDAVPPFVSVSHYIFYLLVFLGPFWKATRAPGHSSAQAPRAAVVNKKKRKRKKEKKKIAGISQKCSGNDKMSRDLEKKCQKNLENVRHCQIELKLRNL